MAKLEMDGILFLIVTVKTQAAFSCTPLQNHNLILCGKRCLCQIDIVSASLVRKTYTLVGYSKSPLPLPLVIPSIHCLNPCCCWPCVCCLSWNPPCCWEPPQFVLLEFRLSMMILAVLLLSLQWINIDPENIWFLEALIFQLGCKKNTKSCFLLG
jgi:hypothetical protein